MTVDYESPTNCCARTTSGSPSWAAICPSRCAGSTEKTDTGLLHPLAPPSLLSVEPPEHTRYRKLVSSVFTTRAVAALRERVEETAKALLDELGDESGVVDIVDALLLAAAGHR